MNKMLVPGYIDQDGAKALAKLSGIDPTKYKRSKPDSPGQRADGAGYTSNLAQSPSISKNLTIGQKKRTSGALGSPTEHQSTRFERRSSGGVGFEDPMSTVAGGVGATTTMGGIARHKKTTT